MPAYVMQAVIISIGEGFRFCKGFFMTGDTTIWTHINVGPKTHPPKQMATGQPVEAPAVIPAEAGVQPIRSKI